MKTQFKNGLDKTLKISGLSGYECGKDFFQIFHQCDMH